MFGSTTVTPLPLPTTLSPRNPLFRSGICRRVSPTAMPGDYDRAAELRRFDDTKAGVKGLVDSNLSTIPRLFVHPPETLASLRPSTSARHVSIPIVDLSDELNSPGEISRACREFGFFQIVNHGISTAILDRTISAIRAFHEDSPEVRSRYYRREIGSGVSYLSNVDLFQSKAASWRDTLQVRLGPTPPENMPEICADAVVEWDREVTWLGERLMGLMGGGLGLGADRLREMTCGQGRTMVGHYYPRCPQPDLTVGLASHTDPGVLTVLMQGHVAGLQVKYGEDWLDVEPVTGSLVINVGDLLQIMSNDEYKSVDHRVLANSGDTPRVSVAVFVNPGDRERMFGPLPELISPEKPPLYREFPLSEFLRKFFTKELDGKSLRNNFKL